MAEVQSIRPADLRQIENNLNVIHKDLEVLDSGMGTVNENVKVVYDQIGVLAQQFQAFVGEQMRANRLGQAEIKLVKIRQEIEKRFGHYDSVRRTTTGILQADDLGIVKRQTITNVTEELMIATPNYWLAPCLVALAAWIDDQPDLAERAVKEGINRDDEKTSLFFALVCRRADRKQSCLKWTQRYLANQDEEKLDRKTIIILDAFASGLLGADSEGVVSRQIGAWLDNLSEKQGFIEQQTKQWGEAINLKRKIVDTSSYTYLRKYSKTWPLLQDIMEGANLHSEIFDYFTAIFNQEASAESIKTQLDEILDSLVTDFDEEEISLRKEEKFEQFVVDFNGDDQKARQSMSVEQTSFETHKDFTQLLTDAAMKPETSHASVATQKFAIALSKQWISNAYSDIIANNRMKIPYYIEINIDNFNDSTTDGKNEQELVYNFINMVNQEESIALASMVLSGFEQFCLYGGGTIAAIGLMMLASGSGFLGLIAAIAGGGMIINHFSKKNNIEHTTNNIKIKFAEKRDNGEKIVRATIAELIDYREEFARKDAESQKVIDFLEQITPEQYIRKLTDTNRRIKV